MSATGTMPKVGVIVVTYNSEDHITDCLESLKRELRGTRCKIAVVDNNSHDGTWKRLSEFPDDQEGVSCFIMVGNETNRGFGSAVNLGAKLVKDSDFYLIVNPDLRIHTGAVREMLSYMMSHPSCGISGPAIENGAGSLIPSSFAFPTLGAEALKLSGVAKYIPSSLRRLISRVVKGRIGRSVGDYLSGHHETSLPKSVDWASGACLLVRKDALGADAMFDERFFLYYEDADLCRRVSERGYSVELLPSARATHSCHGSTGGSLTGFSLKHDFRSMFLYHSKYGSRLTVLLLSLAGLLAGIAQALAAPISAVLGKRKLRVSERLAVCRYLLSASLAALKTAGRPWYMPDVLPAVDEPRQIGARRVLYTKDSPGVSILIPVRNEAGYIRSCLEHICSQDYRSIEEIIIVDGMSTDGTRDIVEDFRAHDGRIQLVDNPEKGVAAALNAGFSAAGGEIVVRADAHAIYAPDYVSQCVAHLIATGAGNVGGCAVPVEGVRFLERAIVLAHTSRFGIGVASFRRQGYRGAVDTVWPGAFPRVVLQQIGKLNQRLNRSEDIDLNARIRKLGYAIYQSPAIRVRYVPRRRLKDLVAQSFANGRGIVETLAVNRSAVRLRHMVPGLFVSAVTVATITACLFPQAGLFLGGVLAAYLAASVWFSCCAGLERGAVYAPAMPMVFGAIHFSYGLGSILGLLSLPRWLMVKRSMDRGMFISRYSSLDAR